MYYFKQADEQSIVYDELLEYVDTLCSSETNDNQDQQTPTNLDGAEDMSGWFASDEAAIWMSL